MRVRSTLAFAAVLCGGLAWAQLPDVQRVCQLSSSDSEKAQEIASAVEAMLGPRAAADKQGEPIRLESAPANLAPEKWLIGALGAPAEMSASLSEDGFRAAVNRLRVTTRSPHVFPSTAARAAVVRGAPAQLSQAAELVRDAARQ